MWRHNYRLRRPEQWKVSNNQTWDVTALFNVFFWRLHRDTDIKISHRSKIREAVQCVNQTCDVTPLSVVLRRQTNKRILRDPGPYWVPDPFMESCLCTKLMKLILWIPWNLSFRYIHSTCQFTPKMKANAEPSLLSSLVWIDSGVMASQHCLASFWRQTSKSYET